MSRPLAFFLVISVFAAAPAAFAEVAVWSADAPFASGDDITVDFDATFCGITGLEAVVTGVGGVQHWTIYQGVDNPTGTVPFAMRLDCAEDPGSGSAAAAGSDWLPILEPFASALVFAPIGDWAFLQDGIMTLSVSYAHASFPPYPMCYGTGFTLPVVEHLDLIVTCDTAVPAVSTSWGTVKVGFR